MARSINLESNARTFGGLAEAMHSAATACESLAKLLNGYIDAWVKSASYGDRLRFHAMVLGGTPPLDAIFAIFEDQ